MRHCFKSLLGFLAGIAGALVLVAIFHLTSWGEETKPAIRVESAPVNRDARLGASFAPVVKKAAPSVVNIYTTRIVHMRLFRSPLFNDPFFRQFFGDRFGPYGSREVTRKDKSLGSGVIVSPDGYILTANHVVDGADEVKVKAGDKKEYTARIIGTDPPTDVAVLKIDAKDLPAITLADSAQLEIGDIVLAIGNPFGLSQTVTMGIISALGRNGLPGFNQYQDFIQTDAAINPGNSGGALVDAEGRLVGINTAIVPNSNGGNQGIGFAVPINLARHVMERLISSGKVIRAVLEGVLVQDVTSDLAEGLNLPNQNGALIGDVEPNSPAEKAGIQSGDVIVGFNGKDITDVNNFQLAVSECAPGSPAALKLLRNGEAKTVTVTLAELRNEVAPADNSRSNNTSPGKSQADALDGVTVANLEQSVREQLNVPNNVQGALVCELDRGSNSAEAGLQIGDLIVEINRLPVRNAEDAVRLGRQAKGNQILLKVWHREGDFAGTHYLTVNNTKKQK
ncbi:MAG: DegQ family serine endoprotease [Verrucomicrobiota bacterium]|jgi:serine protease Do